MIGYLKGKIKYLDLGTVLIEVGGVGYEAQISGAAHAKLSRVKNDEAGELYTYLQVKEDQIALFGFADMTEKTLFLKLTSVQGVGAKTALSILSALSPAEVNASIAEADAGRFAAVKGVGKKTADRIILELHGKISAETLLSASGEAESGLGRTISRAADEDAVAALMGLGFTRRESERAVEQAKAAGAGDVEEIISRALRAM